MSDWQQEPTPVLPEGMALLQATVKTADGSDPGDTKVLIDGDDDTTPALSLIGAVNEGHRVMVLFWPPHGAYIIGGNFGHAWHDVTFSTGWTNYGLGEQNVQYRLEGNTVKLRGVCKRTSGALATMFTLPAGYAPAAKEEFVVISNPQAPSQVTISPSGTVDWFASATSTPAYVSLSGVAFDPYDYT